MIAPSNDKNRQVSTKKPVDFVARNLTYSEQIVISCSDWPGLFFACWIFERYLSGDSLGKIATGLKAQGISSPTGKLEWNREALNKLLSNEKYTGSVLLQKTISTGGSQIKNGGFVARTLFPTPMKPSFLIRDLKKLNSKNCNVQIIQKRSSPYK